MATVVDEINDLTFVKYNGHVRTFNVEDMRLIESKAGYAITKQYEYNNITFVSIQSQTPFGN